MMTYVLAFFGGAFGAMLGGGTAFIVTGLIGIIGLAAGDPTIMFGVALGPFLIPCVSYLAGLIALSYAHKRGYVEENRNVGLPLTTLKKPDVLIFGGLVGVVTMFVKNLVDGIGMAAICDTGGLVVVCASVAASLIFYRKNPVGAVSEEVKKLVGGRFSPKAPAALPNCETGFMRLIIGIIVGGSAAALSYLFANSGNEILESMVVPGPFLIFTALMIVGLPPYFGAALDAAYGYAYSGGSFMWAIVAGVLAIVFTDFIGRLINLYSEGNIDHVAVGFTIPSFVIMGLFPLLGFYTMAKPLQYVVVMVIAAALIAWGLIDEKRMKE